MRLSPSLDFSFYLKISKHGRYILRPGKLLILYTEKRSMSLSALALVWNVAPRTHYQVEIFSDIYRHLLITGLFIPVSNSHESTGSLCMSPTVPFGNFVFLRRIILKCVLSTIPKMNTDYVRNKR